MLRIMSATNLIPTLKVNYHLYQVTLYFCIFHSNFLETIECLAESFVGETYKDACFEGMKRIVRFNPKGIFEQISENTMLDLRILEQFDASKCPGRSFDFLEYIALECVCVVF